jgi:NAD(P)H-flavin reductase
MGTKKEKVEEYDKCVSCGKPTSYKKTDNIVYRYGYIEGAGQCCFKCSQIRKMHKTGTYEHSEWTRYGT